MDPPTLGDVSAWPDWTAAARGALEFLYEHVGWDAWAVTRVEEDAQVFLLSHPADVFPPGTALPWEESFCRLMIAGEAPRVATVTAAVPAYSSRMIGPVAGVAAYIGAPLLLPDGRLLGTLCGVGFRARPRSAARDLPLVEMLARLLNTLLAAGMTPERLSTSSGRVG